MAIKNLYEILGIAPTASSDEISQVLKELEEKYNPDLSSDDPEIASKLKDINTAKIFLLDDKKRAIYDSHLSGDNIPKDDAVTNPQNQENEQIQAQPQIQAQNIAQAPPNNQQQNWQSNNSANQGYQNNAFNGFANQSAIFSGKVHQIFSDPALLRSKLTEYLKTPKSVEKYAQAAEIYYAKSGKRGLKFEPLWSWWGFFFEFAFFLYRKLYAHAAICFIAQALTVIISFTNDTGLLISYILSFAVAVAVGVSARYFVIQDFVKKHHADNEYLIAESGTNRLAALVGVLIYLVSLTTLSSYDPEKKAAEEAAVNFVRMLVVDQDISGVTDALLESKGINTDNPLAGKIKLAVEEGIREAKVNNCDGGRPAVNVYPSPEHSTEVVGLTANVRVAYECDDGNVYISKAFTVRKRNNEWKLDFNEMFGE